MRRWLLLLLPALALVLAGWAIARAPVSASPHGRWSRQSVPGHQMQLFGVSCPSATVCTAVGDMSAGPHDGHLAPAAERWRRGRWSPQKTAAGAYGYLYGVSCPSTRACMAVGASNLAERWDGRRWSVHWIPDANEHLWGVSCSSPTACTAVGTYSKPTSDRSLPLAARWNGHHWRVQAVPNPSYSKESWLQAVSCPSPTSCTAVGFAGYGEGNAQRPLVERWDGHHWTLQKAPSPAGTYETEFQGISCQSASACTAVGDYVKDRVDLTLAEGWNGQSWSVQTTRNPTVRGSRPGSGDWFYRVSCSSETTCTAVGGAGGFESTITLAERWNGHTWSVQRTSHPKPDHASALSGVSCPTATTCTGSYDNWQGPGVPLAERHRQRSSEAAPRASTRRRLSIDRAPLNRQLRKAIKTKGHFPNEDAARKLIYLAVTNAVPQWTRTRGWTKALLAFKIHFGDRLPE